MARFGRAKRMEKAFRFLLGLRYAGVRSALATVGFEERRREEGLALLEGVLRSFRPPPDEGPTVAERSAEAEEWAKRWLAVTRAALRRHAPREYGWLQDKLPVARTQTERLLQVSSFLAWIGHLETTDASSRAARQILREHRLTDAEVTSGQALYDAATTSPPVDTEDYDRKVEAIAECARREEALWAWYRQWSALALVSVRDVAMRRALGFGLEKGADDEEDDAPEAGTEPVLSAPPVAPVKKPRAKRRATPKRRRATKRRGS